jgi:uncharacterized protein YukE
MAHKVEINGNKLNEARTAAKAIETSLKTAYEQCGTLLSYTQAANWDGKSRDAFITYLEIIHQYHNDLNEIVKLQTTALNNLNQYINDFEKDSSVKEVRNL